MELAKEDAAWSAAESGRDVLILCLSLAGAKAAFRGFRDRARKADARCSDVLMEVVFENCGRIRFALASDSLRAVSPDVIVLDGLEGALSVVDRANEVIGRKCRE